MTNAVATKKTAKPKLLDPNAKGPLPKGPPSTKPKLLDPNATKTDALRKLPPAAAVATIAVANVNLAHSPPSLPAGEPPRVEGSSPKSKPTDLASGLAAAGLLPAQYAAVDATTTTETYNRTSELLKKTSGLETIRVPLAHVHFQRDWNARSMADASRVVSSDLAGFDSEAESTGLGGGGDNTLPGLIEAIEAQGQLDPIDVVLNPNPKEAGAPHFFAISGFRRSLALAKIAEWGRKMSNRHPIKADPDFDSENPTIWVVVQNLSPAAARLRNLNENTGQRLSTPDLAWGIEQARRAAKEEGKELSDTAIATQINKSKTLVSQLLKIMRLPPAITHHWRHMGKATFDGKEVNSTSPLGVTLMYGLAQGYDENPLDVEKEYAKLLSSVRPKSVKGVSPEMKSFESALKKASKYGELLGWFAYCLKNIEKPTPGDWNLICDELVAYTRPTGKPATESQLRQMVEHAKEAFGLEQARLANPEGVEEDDEDEEKIQKKRDKRDGGR